MITPLNAINRTENYGYTVQKPPINDMFANNMPNGLLRVPHIDNNKNMSNHNVNDYRKNIFTTHLSPSIGSSTENFLKAKSLISPIYRNNEAIAKYEAISSAPVNFKRIKKTLDRII